MLSKGKFFNPLFKDELLSVMDRLYQDCENVKEFRERLEKDGYYMRLVSDKGKSHYVYGILDRGFYIKDTALPERYRFGKLLFSGKEMTIDEQKHYLYNQIFATIHSSSSYGEFKDRLVESNIKLIEHVNGKGIYGISFTMGNVDTPEVFKSSDISRRLTYQNIQNYFNKEHNGNKVIEPVIKCYISNQKEWERDVNYMYPAIMLSFGMDSDSHKNRRSEDEERVTKKKKRNKGISI